MRDPSFEYPWKPNQSSETRCESEQVEFYAFRDTSSTCLEIAHPVQKALKPSVAVK